ncbi:MAG TPA: class I SAM-dependent methyltransferase [Pyrinomonadaceae bacterium]
MTYSDETYGKHAAPVYDDWHNTIEPQFIDRLTELVGQGSALELGIGTGRIALPLAERGIKVDGIDISQPMLDQLKAKPGAENINLHLGGFADFDLQAKFDLAYVVFNTLFMLTSQAEQVRCFKSVAKHLTDRGSFVLEAFVPDLNRFQKNQANWVTKVTEEVVHLDVCQHDPVAQTVTGQKVVLTDGNVRLYPIKIRYAWPAELDLMAQLAGLRLRERWSNWQKTPFGSESGKHISIYERIPETL